MQLVIDIDENLYTRLFDNGGIDVADMSKACTAIRKGKKYNTETVIKAIKAEQFARWVAEEIFNGAWEDNKDAFAEIACRKLEKLGIVRANDDEWELVETQESEEQ